MKKVDKRRKKFATPSTAPEAKYYGVRACRALFERRPESIIRAYFTTKMKTQFSDLMKWCVGHKLAYHIVTDEELARITASVHHEGASLLARQKPRLSMQGLIEKLVLQKSDPQLLLFVDGVGNPHNLGAILRTAANFGCQFVLGTKASLPEMSPSACRIAEGAAEYVELVECTDMKLAFNDLRKLGYQILATDCHEGKSLFEVQFKSKSCVVIGAEVLGVSELVRSNSDTKLKIPGTGVIESLNVGVATGIILAEFYRQAAKFSQAHASS